MNYLKGYLRLIRKAEERGWERETAPMMTEKHHVFPRSIYGQDRGGTNKRCVYLTLREHYIAHALLMKGFVKRYGIQHSKSAKMIYAFYMMNIMRDKIGYPNSYLYETSREHYINMRIGRKRKPFSPEHIEKLRQRGLGENNHFYGKKHTEESKQKQREKMIGKYSGENSPFYGKTHTEEARKKISLTHKGKKITKENREKCSIAMKNTILINNGEKSVRHQKDQPIPEGWERGRVKDPFIWINNGQKITPIKKNQPIPEGWTKGRLPRKRVKE